MASASQVKKVADIIISDPSRRIIVVSAPGKRHHTDPKMTDLLIRLAESAIRGDDTSLALRTVLHRFEEISEELGLDQEIVHVIAADLKKRLQADYAEPSHLIDTLKAAGEDNAARLLTAYLMHRGIEARYADPRDGLLVSEPPFSVQPLPEAYELLGRYADSQAVHVFPGFFGFTKNGLLRTFNRGGSDITGAILAAAVKAELYENFTDVDSVFAANPNIIEKPAAIQEMTYREMRELSYAGFAVLHDEALMPAFRAGVPVCIKNTNNPAAKGTMIIAEREERSERPVIGISADSGFSTLYVSKYLMNREIGFGRRLLQILEDEGISYEHIPSGIDNLSVIMRSHQLNGHMQERIMKRIRVELEADDVHIRDDFSLVVLVGEGMNHTIGLAARAASAISRTGANIEMINQGSSEVSLSFGVKKEDETKILKELYHEFFGDEVAVQEEWQFAHAASQ